MEQTNFRDNSTGGTKCTQTFVSKSKTGPGKNVTFTENSVFKTIFNRFGSVFAFSGVSWEFQVKIRFLNSENFVQPLSLGPNPNRSILILIRCPAIIWLNYNYERSFAYKLWSNCAFCSWNSTCPNFLYKKTSMRSHAKICVVFFLLQSFVLQSFAKFCRQLLNNRDHKRIHKWRKS